MAVNTRVAGILAALLAGIVWGFLGPVVRELSDLGINSTQITCIRFTVVGLLVLGYLYARERDSIRVDRKSLMILIATGVIGTVFSSVCYLGAMDHINLGLACLLEFVNPFIVMVVCVPLLHERITKEKSISVIIAFIGCMLCMELISNPGAFSLLGITLGVLSGIFFAFHTVGVKVAAARGLSTMVVLFYTSIICGLALIPFCDLQSALTVFATDTYALWLIIILTIPLTLVPSLLFTYSLEKIDAGLAAIIIFVEPMSASIVGFLLYNETMGLESMIGVLLILIALIIVNRPEKNRTGRDQ